VIIQPQRQFLIDIKLNNPSDTATKYVGVVIKNSVSGVVLDTFSLTDNGSNYFSKLWMAPADPTGTGTQITITKTVYDDAGMTQESLVYGTTVETYIVRELAGNRPLLGSGVSSGKAKEIDYKTIEEIVRRVIAEIKMPEFKETDLSEFREHFEKNKDLKEHFEGFKEELGKITAQEPKLSKEYLTKINLIIEKYDEIEDSNEKLSEKIEEKFEEYNEKIEEIKECFENHITGMTKTIEEISEKPVYVELPPQTKAVREKKEEPKEKSEEDKKKEEEENELKEKLNKRKQIFSNLLR